MIERKSITHLNMKIKAYAKVNLCLKVYKGYHESKHKIDSVFYLYKKFYDEITIKPSIVPSVVYESKKKKITISECLVSKTLSYLQEKYGWNINYEFRIRKNIPFGAGLGGGSSDAAAIMNFLVQQHPNTILDLKEIAIVLGSDVPFFLSGLDMARVTNIGEEVVKIYNWQPNIHVNLNGIYSSTRLVFEALEKDEEYKSRVDVDKFIKAHLYKQHSINVVYNDLTKYIINNNKKLQDEYRKYDSHSFFTGAGSSIVTIKE